MTRRHAAALAVLCVAALAACRSQKTPGRPKARTPTPGDTLSAMETPDLAQCCEEYPIGERGTRIDFLGATADRSLHFVQARRAIPLHFRPTRTEKLYVMSGTGTWYVGDKSYPITAGARLCIAPHVINSAVPDEGSTIVALAYLEPPLEDGDDRVMVDATK